MDKWTDAQMEVLERKIHKVYADASKDLQKTADNYFADFVKRDAKQKALVESGDLTEEHYRQWRLNQMARGKRFTKMRDDMAARATAANEVAVAYVNDATPGVYTLNRNYQAYEISQMGYDMSTDFTIYNEESIRRMVIDNPEVMPYYPPKKALARGIDLEYGRQQITASITSGILQGKDCYKISDDLQDHITNMNRASAVRTARTAVTSAQNGGRQATLEAADAMGIKLQRRWVSTKSNRTRDSHAKADGQTVGIKEPFNVGGDKLMFPGDSSGHGWNIYNCRCAVVAVDKADTEGRHVRVRNPKTGRNEIVNDMTYDEWVKAYG